MTITRRRRWVWLLVLPLLLVLSGCMRVHLDADVSSDNLVSGSMVFAFDDDIMDLLPQDEQSMQDELANEGCDLPNSTVTPYAQDGYTGVSCTFSDVTLDEFGGGASGEGDMSLTREGDTFVLTGTLDLREAAAGEGEDGLDFSEAFENADIRFAFTFPGKVEETTGELGNGDRTVTFTTDADGVMVLDARASAQPSSAASNPMFWVWIALAVVAALLVIGVVVSLLRRKKPPTPPQGPWTGGAPQGNWNPQQPAQWNPPQGNQAQGNQAQQAWNPQQGGGQAQQGWNPQQGGSWPQQGWNPQQGGSWPQQGWNPQQGGGQPQQGWNPQQGGGQPQQGWNPQQGGSRSQQAGPPQQGWNQQGGPPQGWNQPQPGGGQPQHGWKPQQQGGDEPTRRFTNPQQPNPPQQPSHPPQDGSQSPPSS